MRRFGLLLVFITLVSPPLIQPAGSVVPATAMAQSDRSDLGDGEKSDPQLGIQQRFEEELEGEFGAEEIAATNSLVASAGIVDWLGPMAPVAMSPFFAITCLSGLSLWGPEWVSDNALLRSAGPLKNEWLFVIFLVLTLVTSLPRLTKVSKPFAQAVDRLEAYSVIIILLAIKLVASMEAGDEQPVAVVQLGVVSMTLDTLLAIAMVINILVINSVKFFFEFLVWLTPIPLLDAIFELCNKSICAALMAIYAFSPTLATVINLCLLAAAAVVFRWVSRKVRFYRTIVLDPLIAWVWKGYATPRQPELIVFPKQEIGPFPAQSRLKLLRRQDDWVLQQATWWLPPREHPIPGGGKLTIRRGWFMHTIQIESPEGESALTLSRRYDAVLDQLASQLELANEAGERRQQQPDLATEFA